MQTELISLAKLHKWHSREWKSNYWHSVHLCLCITVQPQSSLWTMSCSAWRHRSSPPRPRRRTCSGARRPAGSPPRTSPETETAPWPFGWAASWTLSTCWWAESTSRIPWWADVRRDRSSQRASAAVDGLLDFPRGVSASQGVYYSRAVTMLRGRGSAQPSWSLFAERCKCTGGFIWNKHRQASPQLQSCLWSKKTWKPILGEGHKCCWVREQMWFMCQNWNWHHSVNICPCSYV